jgi:AcrR family transcriptional regulator
MGITRPSLYAAFGNKEDLFRQTLDLYERQHLCFAHAALQAPTAREAVERLLRGYVDVLTDPMSPPGCLGVNGAVACSEASEPIREELIARRMVNENNLRDRLEKARCNGDFPEDEDPADWARSWDGSQSRIGGLARGTPPCGQCRLAELADRAAINPRSLLSSLVCFHHRPSG